MIDFVLSKALEILPFALIVTLVYCAARAVCVKAGGKKPAANEPLRALFVMYCAAVAALTLFPEMFWYDVFHSPETLAADCAQMLLHGRYVQNYFIYRAIFEGYRANLTELFLNIVMFVPLGFMLPFINRRFKWWATCLIGLGATCFIELVQPLVGRQGDLDDIITNTVGAVIGCAAARLIQAIGVKGKEDTNENI